jgi:hypothetical protein
LKFTQHNNNIAPINATKELGLMPGERKYRPVTEKSFGEMVNKYFRITLTAGIQWKKPKLIVS